MRYIGLDLGNRTCGLAISDPLGMIATSLYTVRFFEKEDEILRLVDGNMMVCSQWGILNISNFIKRAEQLDYTIEQIIRE